MSVAHLNALVGSKLLDLHLGCSFFCCCCCSPPFFSGQQWLQMISRCFKKINDKNIIIFHEMLFWEFELGLLSCCHDCSHIWEPFFWNRPLKLCVGRIFFFSHTILSFRVYIIFYQKIHFLISFSECGKTMVGRRTCEKTFLWKMTRRRAVFPLEGNSLKSWSHVTSNNCVVGWCINSGGVHYSGGCCHISNQFGFGLGLNGRGLRLGGWNY